MSGYLFTNFSLFKMMPNVDVKSTTTFLFITFITFILNFKKSADRIYLRNFFLVLTFLQ